MFDIGSSELLVVAVVALLVIGPEDLPRVLNQVGKWIGKARSMTRHFKSGLETMAREAELDDMERQWADHNATIMADHPVADGDTMRPLDNTIRVSPPLEDPAVPTASPPT